ncbi:MAG: hypothetical protein ACJZ9A_01760 [Paracoccaceae bacterium]|uniref:hypothetical protein n=1 Tax=Candidatus Salinivivens marinus TaxID=3381703 RepID=UPI000B6DA035|nr:hypothetical protein [Marinovum sp.]OUU07441.1 MAG: hypothetical protein CBB98_12155 [Rhodobacteraceae bacterium TMED38]PDH60967.1 MAG: hypothetical protein CNE96_04030 [Rhodobacteraceae bacterium MED-G08]|tara:strand:+ start:252 stop:905 length:654 start_codon:yes stop_codon:yes gene_type:complete
MNWFATIDGYCERIDASFWSEPLNAVTNVVFLMAAIWVLRREELNNKARALAFLLAMIGIASFLFHSVATAWAGALDVLLILLFTLLYIFVATEDFLGLPRRSALVVTLGYFPFSVVVEWLTLPLSFLGSTRIYIPILVLITLYSLILYKKFPYLSRGLAMGALLLTISMLARSVDLPLCETIPTGTHFLWHVINAIMLAWMIEVYRRHIISRSGNF